MRKTKPIPLEQNEDNYEHGYPHRRHRTRKIKSYIKPFTVRLYKQKKQKYSIEEEGD